jgi:hypothetical protein
MLFDLTKLSGEKLPTEEVPVPEWAELIGMDKLIVGCMTSEERGEFEQKTPDDPIPSARSIVARYVAWCLRSQGGGRAYEDPELAAQHLAPRSSAVITRLYRAAQRCNGVGPEAVDKAEKN